MGNITGGIVGGVVGFAVGGPIGMTVGIMSGGVTGFVAETSVGIAGSSVAQGKYYISSQISSISNWKIKPVFYIYKFELIVGSGLITPFSMVFAPASTLTHGGPCEPDHHYAIFEAIDPDSPNTNQSKYILIERMPQVGDRDTGIHVTVFNSIGEIHDFYPQSREYRGYRPDFTLDFTVDDLMKDVDSLSPNYNLISKNCQHFCRELVDKVYSRKKL
jgi:hypothetical protein